MYSSIISSAASAGAIAGLSASKNSCFDTPSAFFEMILLFALIVVIFYLGYKYFLREESGYSDEKKNKKGTGKHLLKDISLLPFFRKRRF